MQAGLDLSPDDARLNEAMGDIQYRLEKTEDALKYWNIAKEKGGANPALDKKISTKKMEDDQ
jgi:predicted negative regulator of RcsB-dependent stress response